MILIERIAIFALVIVGLYLLFNSANAGSVISSIGSSAGGVLGTLQGRNVAFPQGGQVSGGPISGGTLFGGY